MSEHDPSIEAEGGKRPDANSGEAEMPRPRIRVTDRRHSARPDLDEGQQADVDGGMPAAGEASGTSAGEGGGGDSGGGSTATPAENDELARTKREAAEYRDHLLRLQAEFDNFRKRTLREQTGAMERGAEPLMRRLLDVLDDFDLALMAAQRTPDLEQFMRGVEIVYSKFRDILEAEGLERIDAVGKPFDPQQHEALMHAESEGDGDGELVVDDVFRQGYSLKGRVLRPAGVRVTRK